MRGALLLLVTALPTAGQYFRGVNLAGAEFGQDVLPGTFGTHYWFNSDASFRYFAGKGLNIVRVPLRWERLQPVLRGPLASDYLARLKQNAAWAQAHGGKILIEIHNFGRYKINGLTECILDNPCPGTTGVSTVDFIDLWERLSDEFRNEAGVYAYDLMNEPHQMGSANWKAISQAVLDAIRRKDDDTLIMIPGDDWSSANRWVRAHGSTAWITDPANNFAYEAHLYFDSDESGSYSKPAGFTGTSYDYQFTRVPGLATIGRTRVTNFLDWCRLNNVRGFLGEFGVPNDDERWLAVLDGFLALVDEAGFDAAYWAAGEWWGDYALSVQPRGNFDQDRPQLAALLAHPGVQFLASVSAASGAPLLAPDSLAAGYGVRLLPEGAPLDDVAVEVKDAIGAVLPAAVIAASPAQVNFRVPDGAVPGRAQVWVKHAGRYTAGGTLRLAPVAPALFSANSDGQGIAAAQFVRLRPDGALSFENVARFDSELRRFVPEPVAFAAGERMFLALYGTGFRNSVEARLAVGGVEVRLTYLGSQPTIAGLDQANAELPAALAGRGEVPVVLTADGRESNTVTVAFR